MRIFLISTAGIVILLTAYLVWQYHAPPQRHRSRFQVRLAALFLICVFVPVLPLLFFVSTLLTQSLDVLLIPEVEKSLLSGLEVIKRQIEQHAMLFDAACNRRAPNLELMKDWNIIQWSKWNGGNRPLRLSSAVPDLSEAPSLSAPEPWGGRQSRVRIDGDSAISEVWLPADDTTMIFIECPVAPEVLAAKEDLSRMATIYNSLAVIKEGVVREQIIWTLASAAIIILAAIAVFAARALARQVSGPIEQLSTAMSRAATGDLTFQADISARDEIATLVEAFNKMIRDLRDSREKLMVSERLAAWREVARQISHEIKNPLTPIHLALHRLRMRFEKADADADPQVLKESFQSIDEELAALGRLAEEFSTFARLPEPKREPSDLNEIIRSAVRLHESMPERLTVHADLHPDLPLKMLDRDQVRRVLTNLLKNAQEAALSASTKCEVRLRTNIEGGKIILEVSDNGPGIPASALEKIFHPNFTTKKDGAGIGLAMVKRIVEQHEGSIEVKSAEGKGTTFRILF